MAKKRTVYLMKTGIRSTVEHIEDALAAAEMAWWSLEFPSGALTFSRKKTDMIGYDADDFVHYSHFTDLIHPEDHDNTMQAMRDHYEGRAKFYETTYRIKHKDGHYVTFYDKGQIVERTEKTFIVAGIVQRVNAT